MVLGNELILGSLKSSRRFSLFYCFREAGIVI